MCTTDSGASTRSNAGGDVGGTGTNDGDGVLAPAVLVKVLTLMMVDVIVMVRYCSMASFDEGTDTNLQ